MQRAPKGTGSIQAYGNGKFKGIITIGYEVDPTTGKTKRKTKTFTGKTKKEVQQKITEYQYKATSGIINPIAAPLTFPQYRERWLAMKETQLKPQTYAAYKTHLERHDFWGKKLQDISVADINTVLLSLLKNLDVNTVKTYRTVLHGVFESARKEKLIPYNIVSDSMVPRKTEEVDKQEMYILSPVEAQKLLKTARECSKNIRWLYPLLRTALETGMRKGELRGLQFADLGQDTISIHRSVSDTAGAWREIVAPKTKGSRRTIHVTHALIELLQALPHEEDTEYIFHPNGSPYTPLSGSTIQQYFKRVLKGAKLPATIRLHDLRHTHATWCIMNGVNIKTVSSRLGHSKVQITLDRYTHALPKQDEEAASLVSSMLQRATIDSRNEGK